MRVGVIWQTLSLDSWGAAFARRGHAFLRYLREIGHDAVLICVEDRVSEPGRLQQRTAQVPASRRAIASRYRLLLGLLTFPIVNSRMCMIIRRIRPDVLLVSSHDAIQEFQTALACRLTSVPCILDLQDSWIVLGVEHPRKSARLAYQGAERLACHLSDRVFAMTRRMAEEITVRYRVRADKIAVVPNGADPILPSLLASVRDIDLLHLGPPRTVYGTDRLADGLRLVIERLPRVKILFLGHDGSAYSDSIQRSLRDRTQGGVEFIPFVDSTAVPDFLVRAKLGLHSYRMDAAYRMTVGTKIYEYLAAGVPVVHLGPENGEVGALVSGFECGYATSDPQKMAEWISETLESPGDLEKLSENARRAAAEYTWRVVVEQATSKMLRIVENPSRTYDG